jgi:1,4-dihydroxy-2-naphthoyl-CoA hydrolase
VSEGTGVTPGDGPVELPMGPLPGLDGHLGLIVDELTPDRIVGHVDLDARHHQPFGIVHGGVYCSIVETLGSIAGSRNVPEGKAVVGVNNNTHFLASMSEGRVIGVGTPISRGRTQQLWSIEIRRESDGRLMATGQLRLQAIEPRA